MNSPHLLLTFSVTYRKQACFNAIMEILFLTLWILLFVCEMDVNARVEAGTVQSTKHSSTAAVTSLCQFYDKMKMTCHITDVNLHHGKFTSSLPL